VDQETVDLLIENTLKAVREQFATPLEVALCIMTLAYCYDKKKEWLRKYFERMIATCPDDVAGRCLFEALANITSLPDPPEPGAAEKALNASLQMLSGARDSGS